MNSNCARPLMLYLREVESNHFVIVIKLQSDPLGFLTLGVYLVLNSRFDNYLIRRLPEAVYRGHPRISITFSIGVLSQVRNRELGLGPFVYGRV